MALDTETKRRSMHGMGLMFLVIAPVPDGALSSVDRLHIIGLPGAIAPNVATTAIHKISTSPIEPNHASDSGDNLLLAGKLEAQGGSFIGGVANYADTDGDGKVTFVGTAGLPYANIYAQDNTTVTTITTGGKANKVQITIFDTNGPSKNATPDHTNDHITITKAGFYMAFLDITASGAGGDQDLFGFSLYKNNGTFEFANVHGHETMAGGAGDINDVFLSGPVDLAVNDTIEVWCWNEDDTDNLTIDDISLTLVQIGGT